MRIQCSYRIAASGFVPDRSFDKDGVQPNGFEADLAACGHAESDRDTEGDTRAEKATYPGAVL